MVFYFVQSLKLTLQQNSDQKYNQLTSLITLNKTFTQNYFYQLFFPIMQQPIQNQSPNLYKMFTQVGSFCNQFLNELFLKTFQGVGLENAKRMAPKNTHLQTLYTLESFVSIAFTQKFLPNIFLIDEKDFKPPAIDNLAVFQVQTEKSKRTLNNQTIPSISQSAYTTKTKLKSKKSDQQRSRRISQISEQINITKNKIQPNFQKLKQTKKEFDYSQDPEINKVRNNFIKFEKQTLQREKDFEALKEKEAYEKQRNQKMTKDKKKFTYDYEGKVITQGVGTTQRQKVIIIENRFSQLKKSKCPQPPTKEEIIPERKKKQQKTDSRKQYKQIPLFREKTLSIIEDIEKDKGISAGVKITQEIQLNKSLTKQNPLKKPPIHSLAEFKNIPKESRFKEYRQLSLHNKSQMNISTINNEETPNRTVFQKPKSIKSMFQKQNKSLSSYTLSDSKVKGVEVLQEYQSSRLEKSILGSIDEKLSEQKQKMKYKGLPFIKTKGYKAVDIQSEKSFKLIFDEFSDNSRQKIRSKILINDINLLRTALQDL